MNEDVLSIMKALRSSHVALIAQIPESWLRMRGMFLLSEISDMLN